MSLVSTSSAQGEGGSAGSRGSPLSSPPEVAPEALTYAFCVQLASTLDAVKRAGQDIQGPVAADAALVGAVAARVALDPFAAALARVSEALTVLHTLSPVVCPVKYFTHRFQVFVAAERVVELSSKQLLSLARRCVLGTRSECLVNYVAGMADVSPLLAFYFHARREDVAAVVAAVGIPEGVIQVTRIAPDLMSATEDPPSDISRMVRPQYCTPGAVFPLCVPPSLVPCVRRLALLDVSTCGTPLILVASGCGLHPFDLVLETFVDLGVVPGAVRAFNLLPPAGEAGWGSMAQPSATPCPAGQGTSSAVGPGVPDLTVADLMDIEACIQRGVPVLVRSGSGVPWPLAHHPRLRLHVVHVRGATLAQHVLEKGGPPLTRGSWVEGYARRLWDAVVAHAPLENVPLQTPQWRPVAPGLFQDVIAHTSPRSDPDTEDVALLSEMLHTGREGVQLCHGASAAMADICAVYAAYRRERGYFQASGALGGITPSTLATAACIVNDMWDEGFGMEVLPPPGYVSGIRCRPQMHHLVSP